MIAIVSTFFFWVMRAGKERPNLRAYLTQWQWTDVDYARDEGRINNVYALRLVIANYSSLPNAVLGVDSEVLLPDGSWAPCRTIVADDGDKPTLPVNLSPMTTAPVEIRVFYNTAGKTGGTRAERSEQAMNAIAKPATFRIQVKALNARSFHAIVRKTEALQEA
jgi:hypothetical protein